MDTLSATLRDEMRLVAQKSVLSLKRELAKAIKEMQRHCAALSARVERMERQRGVPVVPSLPSSDETEGRLSPKLIKKLRSRLGLTQPELALLVGVSLSAVGFWESGRVRPRREMREKMIALRRYSRREIRAMIQEARRNPPPKAKPGRPRGS